MASEPLPAQLAAYRPAKGERDAYNYLFEKADTQQLGVLTGDLAVPFFSHSSLPPLILGEVWQIADPDNSGFLSPERFGVACRLIGHAQERNRRGAPEVKSEDVGKPGPLPTFKGYTLPANLAQAFSSTSSSSTGALSPPTSPSRTPAPTRQSSLPAPNASLTTISPTDKANYTRIFSGANGGQVSGLLDGDKAREIWVKSGLPYDVLGQIWTLADTHSRGALDLTDFTIGMHLLHLVLDGSLPRSVSGLPKVLDPKMYAAAAGLPLPGQQQQQPPQAAPSTPAPAPATPAAPSSGWLITPAEKSESDTWFAQLDTQNRGTLEGDQAVGFFGQSGLDVAKLAKIWDLADFENKGYLTKDTFAVAMHLVKKAVADPSFILPDSLPANLRPPSTSSHKAGAGAGQVQRDLLDLMGDDDEAPSTPAAAPAQRSLSPQLTGQRTPIPPPIQATMQPLPLSPQGTGQPQRIGSLSPQATGGSARAMGSGLGSGMAPSPLATRGGGFGDDFAPASSPALAPPAPPPQQQQQKTSSTFFDENDDADLAATASSLSSRASALRSEQAGVSKDLESTTASRAELEQQVQSHNKEIESLQAQVAAAREAFETERTRVDELRARRDEQKRVLDRARHELISAQSDLSGLRMEKTEVEGEVLRDKEEVREVKRQVAMVEEEKRILAAEIDKIRKDLRREKGLGAIARKQLASVEADRARLESDLERARAGNLEGDAETGEAEKGIVTAKDEAALAATAPTAPAAHAAAVPLPATPAAGIASPAASTRSTNPFDRFTQPQNQHQMGLSPQPTGGSASTNPFASFGTHAQPQERAIETPQQQQHDEKTSLPVAAAAAIGTGALAALGAAGAGIAHAVGVGKDGDEDKKQADQEPRAAQDGDAGTDPFGVPSTVEAKDARDDGFGDDFAASTAQPSAGGFEDDAFNVTPTATTAPAGADDGFDDEFKAFDSATPAASSAAGPVQGTLGEIDSSAGFTDAVRDLSEGKGPDAVEGTLGEVDKDAGFDEAFHEVEDHQQASSTEHEATEAGAKLDKGKEKAVEHDVFGEGGVGNSTPPRADYNSDSDDDEAEGPEEAFGTTRPHQRDLESSADESGFATPAAASTDLGASSVADVAAVTGAAPLAHDAEAGPTAELASRGAGEQARTNDSSESGESYVHVDVGPTGTAESVDMLESPAPASFQPASPAVTPTQRRAAPPPPQRSAVPAISTPPAVSPFSGDADKGVATVGTEVEQPASKPEDDFESAFADMDVSSPPGTSSINAPTSTTQPDLDSFDNDFDFQPSFDEAEAVSSAQTAHNLAAVQTEVAPNDFDDAAFADFDSTFARDAPQAQTQAQAERADDGFDSAFDDSFGATPASAAAAAPALTTGEGAEGGAPALGAPLDSASTAPSVPQYAPPPGPPPPPKHHSTATVGDEDSDAVKMIKQMGFSREQAVDALEKYDYDVNRAVNSLVG